LLVVLADGRFLEARLLRGVESSFAELADVAKIAIDVPMGYGPREADTLEVGTLASLAVRPRSPGRRRSGHRGRPVEGRGQVFDVPFIDG
jgi:hypothetical protein